MSDFQIKKSSTVYDAIVVGSGAGAACANTAGAKSPVIAAAIAVFCSVFMEYSCLG